MDEDTTALQARLCYPCALADPQVRIKGGKGLSMGTAPELAATVRRCVLRLHFCPACMACYFLTSWMLRSTCLPAGRVPGEIINVAAGSAAAGGTSVAGAASLARGSAGQSAAADAVARGAGGSGAGAAEDAEARSDGHIGTNQIGMVRSLIKSC